MESRTLIEERFNRDWPRISEWIPDDLSKADVKKLAVWLYSEGFASGFEFGKQMFTTLLKD